MSLHTLLEKICTTPETIEFIEVIDCIAKHYHYSPTRFSNGVADNVVINEAGTNEGSCRIFAFAQLNTLNEKETLACFGQYYRNDVLQHPDASDHANIRNFMQHGWRGIQFDNAPLTKK